MKNNPEELISDLKVIRTIHSNNAVKYSIYNFWYKIITIIVAVIVTFVGFSGIENISKLFFSHPTPIDNGGYKFSMDMMTLSILVISILGIILQYEKKASKHNLAVTRLSEFISDIAFKYPNEKAFKENETQIYSERYKSIIGSLPATKDSDYFNALITIQKKKKRKKYIESEKFLNDNYFERKWKLFWI